MFFAASKVRVPFGKLLRACLPLMLLACVFGAHAQDWGPMATISSTMGTNAGRLCIAEASRGDIGCPTYAPSVTAAGHVSVTGHLSASKFIGDGSGLTGVGGSSDRIVSGTTSVTANTTGSISLTTAGTTTGYFDSVGRLVLPGISITTPNGISSTYGYFSNRIGIGAASPTAPLQIRNSVLFDEGGGATANGADIRMTSSGLIAADLTMIFQVDLGDIGSGSFLFNKGAPTTTSATTLMTLGNNGNLSLGYTDTETDSRLLTVKSYGYAGLIINGDLGNPSGEPGGAYLAFGVDGNRPTGQHYLGITNRSGEGPTGISVTDSIGNSLLMGTIYNTTSGHIQFAPGNAVNMTMLGTNGYIGMGKTNPAYQLDVSGTVRATAFIGDGAGLTNLTGDNLGNHTATQNLGLGANAIVFGNTIDDKVYYYSNTYGVGIESSNLTHWSGSSFRWRIGGTSASTGTERMSLNASGLVVHGMASVISTSTGNMRFASSATNGNTNYIQSGNSAGTTGSWQALAFGGYNNTVGTPTRMIIDDNGNVGISTSTPITKLDVNGDATVRGNISLYTGGYLYGDNGDASYTSGLNMLAGGDLNTGASILLYGKDVASANAGRISIYSVSDSTGTGSLINFYRRTVSGTNTTLLSLRADGTTYLGGTLYANYTGSTAAEPTYSFNGDTNTGIFRDVADQLGFSTAGTESMRILANGRVGIGEATPSHTLVVANTANGATGETAISVRSQGYAGIHLQGNVFAGCGGCPPQYNGGVYTTYRVGPGDVTDNAAFVGQTVREDYSPLDRTVALSGAKPQSIIVRGQASSANFGGVQIYDGNTQRMEFRSGLATVYGNLTATGNMSLNTGGYLFGDPTNSASILGLYSGLDANSGAYITLYGANHASTPGRAAYVSTNDGTATSYAHIFYTRSTAGVSTILFDLRKNGAATFLSTVNVGTNLTVDGQTYVPAMTSGRGNNVVCFTTSNGALTQTNNAAGCTVTSDARLKKDVEALPQSLEKILALRPVTFHWKDVKSGKDTQYGFIAQEVNKVLPELTYAPSKENAYWSMSTNALIPYLVKGVQELKMIMDRNAAALRADNAKLEARVGELEASNKAMAAQMEELRKDVKALAARAK